MMMIKDEDKSVIYLEKVLKDIIEEYTLNEIREESRTIPLQEQEYKKYIKQQVYNIKKYAAYSISINVKQERNGAHRYDWDSITYKDHNGNLLDHVCAYMLSKDDISKKINADQILYTIQKNAIEYIMSEFNDKVEEEKNYYHDHGQCEYYWED